MYNNPQENNTNDVNPTTYWNVDTSFYILQLAKKVIFSPMQHLILLYAKNVSFIQQRIYLLEDISFKDNTVL